MFATMLHYLRSVISLKKDMKLETKSLYKPFFLPWDPFLACEYAFCSEIDGEWQPGNSVKVAANLFGSIKTKLRNSRCTI